jgi:NADP-dependent 3-hydroxy acid dehydrogenase YdfG/acyl carrier protein
LLGAVVELAEGRGWVFTGRLALDSHAWLADHVVLGRVLLAGTAFLELVLHVGGRVGYGVVRELTIEVPLLLGEGGAVQVQVVVGERDESGERPVVVYARVEGVVAESGEGPEWVRHAGGVLSSEWVGLGVEEELAGVWPPVGAEAVEVEGLYERLAGLGFEYGPVFRGVRAGWRRGEEVFTEVALPGGGGGVFGLHPALLDSAFHVLLDLAGEGERGGGERGARLPFAWSGVRLGAGGASMLRVALRPCGREGVSLVGVGESGEPVVVVESLVGRVLAEEQLGRVGGGAGRGSLFALGWPVSVGAAGVVGERLVVVGDRGGVVARGLQAVGVGVEVCADVGELGGASGGESDGVEGAEVVLVDCVSVDGAPGGVGVAVDGAPAGVGVAGVEALAGVGVAGLVRGALGRVLGLVQWWLGQERFVGARLVLVTRGAVAAGGGEGVDDLAGAAVWGLVRSAESEHPGRFGLLDVDGSGVSWEGLGAALGCGEREVALRGGQVRVPRLERVAVGGATSGGEGGGFAGGGGGGFAGGEGVALDGRGGVRGGRFDGRGTVLVTGGTGGLGALVAERLVVEHGVRRLLLVSRRGAEAEGAGELRERLEGRGAEVEIAACDVADRARLRELFDAVPAECPLSAVVHTAGTGENALVESLELEQFEGVLAGKVEGALNLHALSEGLDLQAFVVFSSMAGVFGGPGQGNYAAANAFLDGLVAHRRARGLAGTSLAWGLWRGVGMGRDLGALDMRRMTGSASLGVVSAEQGLELFDAALGCEEALLLPVPLDGGVLRAEARAGSAPVLLSALVRVPTRQASTGGAGSLARRLAGLSQAERESAIDELLRGEVAIVLGHASGESIDREKTFKDLGFDSLAAVELRNRLNTATGLRLPATLTFDYPTSAAAAQHVLDGLARQGIGTAVSVEAELAELERRLTSLAADDSGRTRVTALLQALLAGMDTRALPIEDRAENGDDDLRAATAQEVFELIDTELDGAHDRVGGKRERAR